MGVQLTNSKTSVIPRRKRPESGGMDPFLLPGDLAYIKSLDENKQLRDSKLKEKQQRLQNLGPADLNRWKYKSARSGVDVIVGAIDLVLSLRWDMESPAVRGTRGVMSVGKALPASILKYRETNIPPLVTTSQLSAVFPNDSTFVDRQITRSCQAGKIRRFQLTLSSSAGELFIKASTYYENLDEVTSKAGDPEQRDLLLKFKRVLQKHPEALTFSSDELANEGLEMTPASKSVLLQSGFLTLHSGRSDTFDVTIPNIGSFVKLMQSSRQWVLKTVGKLRFSEMVESTLEDRWKSSKSYIKEYKACSIKWVMMDAFGGGWAEPFNTPVGIGWKLSGKS